MASTWYKYIFVISNWTSINFCLHRHSAAIFKICCHQYAYALSSIYHKCGCEIYFLQLRWLINSQDRDRIQLNYVEERKRLHLRGKKQHYELLPSFRREYSRQHITQIMVTRSHRVFKVKANAAEYSLSLSFSSISSSFKTYSSWHLSLYAAHIIQFKHTHTRARTYTKHEVFSNMWRRNVRWDRRREKGGEKQAAGEEEDNMWVGVITITQVENLRCSYNAALNPSIRSLVDSRRFIRPVI